MSLWSHFCKDMSCFTLLCDGGLHPQFGGGRNLRCLHCLVAIAISGQMTASSKDGLNLFHNNWFEGYKFLREPDSLHSVFASISLGWPEETPRPHQRAPFARETPQQMESAQ